MQCLHICGYLYIAEAYKCNQNSSGFPCFQMQRLKLLVSHRIQLLSVIIEFVLYGNSNASVVRAKFVTVILV